MEFIIAQILGVIAAILSYSKMFLKKKGAFLLFQTISTLFSASSYLFLHSWVAGIISAVSILRCLYLYFAEKANFKYTAYFLPIFIIFYIVIGTIFWSGPLDIIPIITSSLFTIAYYVKDLQTSRYILLLPNLLLAVFSFLTLAYANACKELLELVVTIIAIIKFHFDAKKVKNNFDSSADTSTNSLSQEEINDREGNHDKAV